MLASHVVNKLKCPQCPKEFRYKDTLRNHVQGDHKNKKDYQCENCDKAFVTKQQLINHAGFHDTTPRHKSSFSRHMKICNSADENGSS